MIKTWNSCKYAKWIDSGGQVDCSDDSDKKVVGSIPAYTFFREPAILKFVWWQRIKRIKIGVKRTVKKEWKNGDKIILNHAV